jgi:hypothetical protein
VKGECENLQQNLEQCQAESEDMLCDLVDSASCVDDLKQKLALKNDGAFIQLEKNYKLEQERAR